MAEDFNDYATTVAGELKARDIRVTAELGDSRLNAKIRNCQTRKIPYMLVVGKQEAEAGTVAIRLRDGRQLPPMKTADFADYITGKIRSRDLEL